MTWNPAERLFFRIFSIYLLLIAFPFPLEAIAGLSGLSRLINQGMAVVIGWIGRGVLGFEAIETAFTGSGDRTFDYLMMLISLVIALLGGLIWTAFDHKRAYEDVLAHWLRVYCRYYVATAMVTYGLFKVFKSQFPFPRLERLLQPYGESSPMGLMWTFMGYSEPYNIFTGGMEMLGGLLLFCRRTTALGALVVIGVMSNVAMLNFSYDVPVKLYSCHLLLIAVVLVWPDRQRLLNVLLLNRSTSPRELTPHATHPRWRRVLMVVKILFIGQLLISTGYQTFQSQWQWGDKREKPPLYGIYDVETFTLDGEPRPPLTTDEKRWQNLIIDLPGRLSVRYMNGTVKRYVVEVDEAAKVLTFTIEEQKDVKDQLTFSQPSSDRLEISGELEGQNLEIRLVRRDLRDFLLVSRGFNWINEKPFNR